jgi:cobalt-zinc-cadmium resistance protein CzcA
MRALVYWALRSRGVVVALTLTLCVLAAVVARGLTLDALPDVTTNQVLVLTRAPGLTPEEVERLVTRPIESALGGMPGLNLQRSLSRYGISSVTAVFDDDVDPYRARQVVQERLQGIGERLPVGVDAPALGPLTGGLGEIFHFALSSPDAHARPSCSSSRPCASSRCLRSVPGVVEVNPWGGATGAPSTSPPAPRTWPDCVCPSTSCVGGRGCCGWRGGGEPAGRGAQVLLRGASWPRTPAELGGALVRQRPGEAPVRWRRGRRDDGARSRVSARRRPTGAGERCCT